MIITLVRHGEIDNNYLGCYNGHIDIALSERGQKEASSVAKQFEHSTFNAVFCSDLIRTRETLHPFSLNVEPTFTNQLREKSWGSHEGMTFDAIVKRDSLTYDHFEQWINALDGEPYTAYVERIHQFFLEFLPSQPYDSVLVMTHAGVIRVLYAIILKLNLEEAFSIPFPYAAHTTLDTENPFSPL